MVDMNWRSFVLTEQFSVRTKTNILNRVMAEPTMLNIYLALDENKYWKSLGSDSYYLINVTVDKSRAWIRFKKGVFKHNKYLLYQKWRLRRKWIIANNTSLTARCHHIGKKNHEH